MQDKLHAIQELIQKRDVKRAELLISRLLRADLSSDDVVRLLSLRARTHLLSVNPDQALKDLDHIRQIAPEAFDQPHIQEMLADSYLARFELAVIGFTDRTHLLKAQRIYHSILEQHPDYHNTGWILYQVGRSLLAADEVEQAVDYFQRALNHNSHHHAHKAYCYERMGFIEFYSRRNLERALELLNLALAVYPNDADPMWLVQLHLQRARLLQAAHKPDAMVRVINTAIRIAIDELQHDRAFVSDTLFTGAEMVAGVPGCEQQAIELLERFVQVTSRPIGINVTWSRAYEIMGDMYFQLGRYIDAATAYNIALEFNPYHPWGVSIRYRLAKSQYQQGSYEQAVITIQQMIAQATNEAAPLTDYRVYDILGNALFALERYPEAADAYRIALSLAPESAEGVDKIKLYYHFSQQLAQE